MDKKSLEKIGKKLGYKYIRYAVPFKISCLVHKKEIDLVKSLLADKLSLDIYEAALKCHKTRNNKYLRPFYDAANEHTFTLKSGRSVTFDATQYFPDVINLSSDEVFIDGGGFIGDTALQFANKTKGKFRKIHVFEPIPKQYDAILQNTEDYKDKIAVHNVGLSSSKQKAMFEDAFSSARAGKKGKIEVELVSLDSFLTKAEQDEITYIKLDVEGAELAALKGMKNIISKNKPKLGICIYHKPEDLWEIPLYIRQLNPNYRFYIRQHHPSIETVLYAIM